MESLKSASGKKQVNFKFNEYCGHTASYVQVFCNGVDNKACEDVIECKSFKTEKSAIKWAKAKLDIA